ncbi:MAG: NAD(P)/FAD-dependent oxidoreductase [Telluria sp.]
MDELSEHVFDTLVIGGGPGGLTAAIYLRRFTRNIVLVDKGNSRLCMIPVSHNYPGFPEGVPGSQLLTNLTHQLKNYGGSVLSGEITSLRLEDGTFVGDYVDDAGEVRPIRALTVLLATGVADVGLPIENYREAVAAGAVRLCPVCDGYDVRDRRIAVVTSDTNPVGHALFMRSFSADVTLFDRSEEPMLSEEQRRQIEVAGVRYIESPLRGVTMSADMKPVLNTADGESREFDVFYPMLGESARSKLACELGAETGECDKLIVDDHQRTNVPGLYAIGDVVLGLNQIAVAAGQAAIAATTIHNALPWALRPKVEAQQAA